MHPKVRTAAATCPHQPTSENGILNRGLLRNKAEGVGNNGEKLENKIRGFYLPKDYLRMGTLRDGKKLFPFVLS